MTNIEEVFDKFYNIYKEELNNGDIAIVGSVLHHVTGVRIKEKIGDIDIIILTKKGEEQLVLKGGQLDIETEVKYSPNSEYRKVKIYYGDDRQLIESFNIDITGGEIKTFLYNNKEYTMYIQDHMVSLLNTVFICSLVNDRRISAMKNNDEHQINRNNFRTKKQIANVEYLLNYYKVDPNELENVFLYNKVKNSIVEYPLLEETLN